MRRLAFIAMLFLFHLNHGCMAFHAGPLPGAPKNATYADVEGVRVRYVEAG